MNCDRVNMIYIVDGIRSSRHAKCSIQGSKGQHHHWHGDAVMYTRDAVCAKCYIDIMNGWDISCINNRVVVAITSQDALVARCKGMEYFIVILIIFLLKKRNHLKREEAG